MRKLFSRMTCSSVTISRPSSKNSTTLESVEFRASLRMGIDAVGAFSILHDDILVFVVLPQTEPSEGSGVRRFWNNINRSYSRRESATAIPRKGFWRTFFWILKNAIGAVV